MELPYISEERLQKMGIPMGPRMRILQEAQVAATACSQPDSSYSVYIVWYLDTKAAAASLTKQHETLERSRSVPVYWA